MPLTGAQILEFDRKPTLVTTQSGQVVAFGLLRVRDPGGDAALHRVDLHFETDSMRCVLGVPLHRLETLNASWDGKMYRYVLPSGDQLWLPPEPTRAGPPPGPIVETFSLPPHEKKPERRH